MKRIITTRKVSKVVRNLPSRVLPDGRVVTRRLVTKKTSYSRKIEG
jgi:hypothetical protein